ncbi:hypothetical protein AB0N14_17430 [Streptomyces sp. NPDC051104]|uniref:hypothetical protein n=1 Tax=Streptomyces sp. NPDC051104 TaxID=3155044 RepID=UPI00342BBDA7
MSGRSSAPRPRVTTPSDPPVADHVAVVSEAQAHPGQWQHCYDYRTTQAADAVARMIRDGRIRAYLPRGAYEAYAALLASGEAAVWVRYLVGVETTSLPETMTVRVPDYGTQPGYEGVRVRTVEISSYCPACGGPRGTIRSDRFVRDGVRLTRDAWDNPCGHRDSYPGVLAEAHRLATTKTPRDRRKAELRGVLGGRRETAVNFLAAAVKDNTWLSAHKAVELLEDAGFRDAAAEVIAFQRTFTTSGNASARSAVLYLNRLDEEALQRAGSTGQWIDGPVRSGKHQGGRK